MNLPLPGFEPAHSSPIPLATRIVTRAGITYFCPACNRQIDAPADSFAPVMLHVPCMDLLQERQDRRRLSARDTDLKLALRASAATPP